MSNGIAQEDPTRGVAPFMELPELVVGEKRYKVRRLGILDVWRFAKIIKDAGSSGISAVVDLVRGTKITETQAGMFAILFGLADQEKPVMEWVANLLGTDYGTITNPDIFPLESMVDIIEVLAKHPDMSAFLARLEKMSKDSELMNRISTLSGSRQQTKSSQDTPGSQTNN